MKTKNILLLLILIVAAVLVGGLLAAAAQHISYLSWLGYSKSFGIAAAKPMLIDLSVLRFSFGLEISVNVAQILCLIVAVLLYRRLR